MAEVFRAESAGLEGFKKQVAIKRVLPAPQREEEVHRDVPRRGAPLGAPLALELRAGLRHRRRRQRLLHRHGVRRRREPQGRRRVAEEAGQATFPVEAAAFIAVEDLQGPHLRARARRTRAASRSHIVHRDMSPPNVLITKYGEVKIVDFGLAKATSQLEKSEPGIIKGKFSYLSPEAALGQEVDTRTDIFAVGIILWEMLAGQRLFLGDTDFQTVKKVQQARRSRRSRRSTARCRRSSSASSTRRSRATRSRATGRRASSARTSSRFLFTYRRAGQHATTSRRSCSGAMREKQRVRAAAGLDHRQADRRGALRVHFIKGRRGARFRKHEGSRGSAAEHGLVRRPDELGERDRHQRGPAPATGVRSAPRSRFPREVFEQGNLSALEDAEPLPPSHPPPSVAPMHHSSPPGSMPAPGSSPMNPVATGPHNVQRSGAHPTSKPSAGGGPGSAAIGVVLFLVVAAAAGAAWFTGLIPHH